MKTKQFPRFRLQDGSIVYAIAWAMDTFRSGWAWIATDIVKQDSSDILYYGYVKTHKEEFRTFSKKALEKIGITIYTNPETVDSLRPPEGWTRLPDVD